MRSLLVPVDGSDNSNRAARFAASIASETGAQVTLLYAYDAPTAAALGLARLSDEVAKETIQRVAAGSFEAARTEMSSFDVEVQTHVTVGNPSHEIVSFARSQRPDLIVMGTRGHAKLRQLLTVSTAERIAEHAPRLGLTLHPRGDSPSRARLSSCHTCLA